MLEHPNETISRQLLAKEVLDMNITLATEVKYSAEKFHIILMK